MSTIFCSFGVSLLNPSLGVGAPNGLLCHAFLPDGESDAVQLHTDVPKTELRIWFQRRGDLHGSCITYSNSMLKCDPAQISNQAVIDAGPLYGVLKLSTEVDILPVAQPRADTNWAHEKIAKEAVKLIQPPVSRFIEILRTNYGQYWLEPLPHWDARYTNLSQYCEVALQLRWSNTVQGPWFEFALGNRVVSGSAYFRSKFEDFSCYFNAVDMQEAARLCNTAHTPELAAIVLLNAWQFFDNSDYRRAIIEAVTATELAIELALKTRDVVKHRLSGFASNRSIPLATKLALAAMHRNDIGNDELKLAIDAIEKRNKIVHDGINVQPKDQQCIEALIQVGAKLIPHPSVRLLHMKSGNMIRNLE